MARSVPRNDIDEKITGAAILRRRHPLWRRFTLRPHQTQSPPHALIKSIDTSKAAALLG
ncbi:MAG: hypothetical protein M5U34_38370 [Chloroflexi bacterium]|nr:hypothetical protein [Chloroflexota bacterium]